MTVGDPADLLHFPPGRPTHRPDPGVTMPTQTATDPRPWRADTIDAPDTWYYPLSERALSALDQIIAQPSGDRPVTDVRATADLRAACADDIAPVLAAL